MNIPHSLGFRSSTLYTRLRAGIADGTISVGDKLLSERELCKEYNLSRTTVRRALAQLERDGLVTIRHGSGIFVSRQTPLNEDTSQTKVISVMFSIDSRLLATLQERALAAGLLICPYPRAEMGWNPEQELRFFDRIRQSRHHALLAFCTPTEPRNDAVLAQLEAAGVRVLHIEHFTPQPPPGRFHLPDYRKAGYMAAVRLLMTGYKHLAVARIEHETPVIPLLIDGFRDAVRDYAGPGADVDIINFPVRARERENADTIRRIIADLPPSAGILCSNIPMANDLLHFLREAGRTCPGDCGLIGIPYLDHLAPSDGIDTVEFDWRTALVRALELVLEPEFPDIREWHTPHLVERGSTRRQ